MPAVPDKHHLAGRRNTPHKGSTSRHKARKQTQGECNGDATGVGGVTPLMGVGVDWRYTTVMIGVTPLMGVGGAQTDTR